MLGRVQQKLFLASCTALNMGSVFGGIVAGGIIGNNATMFAIYTTERISKQRVKFGLLNNARIGGTSVGALAGAVTEDALLNNPCDHREK